MNVVVSQALATGLPVIVTKHSGLPEQVLDGINGFVTPENDPAALADKIICLIENAQSWPKLGQAGRAHVKANYDSKALMDRQLADYRRLINSADGNASKSS